ncbi:hypothetical protein MMC30_004748 [Trapelia coarctata]|nr:hypothetical protein [Trapelia coarctata]
MANPPAAEPFYTHETELSDKSNKHITLRSNTLPLELRSPTPSDLPALLEVLYDTRNTKDDRSMDGMDKPTIKEAIEKWVIFSTADPVDRVTYVVLVNGTAVGIGGMGYIGTENGRRIGAAGIMLNTDARGKGYAYEALRMTIDHALRVLGIDEVHIATTEANLAMRGLMEKNFRHVATMYRGTFKFGNEYLWKITARDWLLNS